MVQLKLVLIIPILYLCFSTVGATTPSPPASNSAKVGSTELNTGKSRVPTKSAGATTQKALTNLTSMLQKSAVTTPLSRPLNTSVPSKAAVTQKITQKPVEVGVTPATTAKPKPTTAKPNGTTTTSPTPAAPQIVEPKKVGGASKPKQGEEKEEVNEDISEELIEENEKEPEAEKVDLEKAEADAGDTADKSKSGDKPAKKADQKNNVALANKSKTTEAKQKELEEQKQKALVLQASASGPSESNGYAFVFILSFGVLLLVVYILVHNKNKILGLLLEGRSGRRASVGRRAGNVKYRRLSTTDNPSANSCAVHVDSEQRNVS